MKGMAIAAPLLRLITLAKPVVPYWLCPKFWGAPSCLVCHWSSQCSAPSYPNQVAAMASRVPLPRPATAGCLINVRTKQQRKMHENWQEQQQHQREQHQHQQ